MAISLEPVADADIVETYGDAFPNSRKVYVTGAHDIRVPFREIHLSGGEPPLRVYDTSGPRSHDIRDGLPELRADWIQSRGDVSRVARSYRASDDAKRAEIPMGLQRGALRG